MTVVPGNESIRALAGGKQSDMESDLKPDVDGAQDHPYSTSTFLSFPYQWREHISANILFKDLVRL